MGGRRHLLLAAALALLLAAPQLTRQVAAEPGHKERDEKPASGEAREQGVETENLFGFIEGSDTGEADSKGVAAEAVLRSGKRIGTYRTLGTKLEFGFGVTDDLNMSFAALGDCHRIRNVPEFDDVRGRCGFDGIGTELRWRLANRRTAPFGLTLQLEPSFRRFDELSGKVGRALVLESKLILDRELVPDLLYGAVNLVYDLERVRERFATASERGSLGGIGGALALRLSPTAFAGAELRYVRAYEGLAFRRFAGDAVYVGPTLFLQPTHKTWRRPGASRFPAARPRTAARSPSASPRRSRPEKTRARRCRSGTRVSISGSSTGTSSSSRPASNSEARRRLFAVPGRFRLRGERRRRRRFLRLVLLRLLGFPIAALLTLGHHPSPCRGRADARLGQLTLLARESHEDVRTALSRISCRGALVRDIFGGRGGIQALCASH